MIEIHNLTKSFGEHLVFKNLNLQFKKQEIHCILGKSGCGKTTLLHILMGLTKADEGSISGLPHEMTAVFQENRLLDEFSAVQNIQLACSDHIEEQDIINALQEVGFTENIHIPTKQISGGMARRCAVVRAFIPESELIILDEPLSNLDQENQENVISFIKKYQKGRTIIAVMHDLEQAKSLTSNILYLSNYK
ncbi:MAG TPA: ATP-binding cassette domain-containing protein [Clostridiaceae bacterium]|jgi:NitT/TauT family transport system ATP-binding protein|nr:ATP-binding cassette domain-containing protein [Clostridiaceae bacterium]